MRTATLTCLLTCMCGIALAQGLPTPATQPAPPPTPADRELADSILQDAAVGDSTTDVRRQVRCASVLARLALQVDPGNWPAWRMLAEAAETLGDFALAERAERGYLRAVGGIDHEAAVRTLRYSLTKLSTAEQRQAMLAKAIADPELSRSVQATALANLAAIKEGQGDRQAALGLYRRALVLDASHPESLRGLARWDRPFGPDRQVTNGLAMLQGNPMAVNVAWELGQLCRTQGLYAEAVTLYEYARAIALGAGQTPSQAFRRDFLDALLDAEQYDRAEQQLGDLGTIDPIDLGAASLVVETFVQQGKTDAARGMIARMYRTYQSWEGVGSIEPLSAAELAWFHLRYRRRTLAARRWAAIAMASAPDDPFVQRVWGIAFLGSDRSDEARKVLSRMADDDAYAAAALAAHALGGPNRADGARLINQARNLSRKGRPWRELDAVASRNQIPLPPLPASAEGVRKSVDEFMAQGYVQMGTTPEEFLAVELKPVSARVAPGEPIAVRATLTNKGPIPMPLGSWGIVTPKMMLSVSLLTAGRRVRAEHQVAVIWPAPRYLPPGRSLHQVVRVDEGRVGAESAFRPLQEVELIVKPMLDPVERDGKFLSALPRVPVLAARIVRKPLIDTNSPDDYYEALKALVRRLRAGDPVQAMAAAETTVALLALTQEVQAGRPEPAGKLSLHLRTNRLLAMLRYCLQETSPVVRSRTLGAMRRLKLTNLMVKLLAPCLGHASPLVRARAVQLLGATGQAKYRPILESFAGEDPDELVREMAACVLPPERRPPEPAARTQPASPSPKLRNADSLETPASEPVAPPAG